MKQKTEENRGTAAHQVAGRGEEKERKERGSERKKKRKKRQFQKLKSKSAKKIDHNFTKYGSLQTILIDGAT